MGTKQLKNQLSHYLQRVRAGEVVKVTDRGRVIAEMRAVTPDNGTDAEMLRELDAVGTVSAGSGRFRDFLPVRGRGGPSASEMIREDRD